MQTVPAKRIRQQQVVEFLRNLRRHYRGPIILIWDSLQAHRGKQVQNYLARHAQIHVEVLPGYAPELNPNEYVWGYLKGRTLAHYCPNDVMEVNRMLRKKTRNLPRRRDLLRGFFKATRLSLRL